MSIRRSKLLYGLCMLAFILLFSTITCTDILAHPEVTHVPH